MGFLVGEHINVPEYILDTSWFYMERTQKLCIWDPPRPHTMGVFFSLVQICILGSKTVSRALSWVLWVVLPNYQIWKGHGNPQSCSQLFRSVGGLGTLEHVAGVRRERSLWRTVPFPCKVCANPGWLVSELHCSLSLNDWMNLLQSSEGGKGQAMSCLLTTALSKRKLSGFTQWSAVSLGKAVTKVLVLELILLQSLRVC